MSDFQNESIWVSSDDLQGSKEFTETLQSEFQNLSIVDNIGSDNHDHSRRDFLKYLGFSVGAATIAAACETPARRALPYVTKPDSIVPGIANYYASSYVRGGDYCPILVKTREGRPIKIEGNRQNPFAKGGTSARVQAAVLDLYDSSRFQFPGSVTNNAVQESDWNTIDKAVIAKLNSGSTIRLISHTNISPSTKAAISLFKSKFPNTEWVQYDPVSCSAILMANEKNFGQRIIPGYRFDKADCIVSFGADFLATWISPIEYAAQYVQNRQIKDVKSAQMSRFFMVESHMSYTGSNADQRILIRPSEQGLAIAKLYNLVAASLGSEQISVSGKLANSKSESLLKSAADNLVSLSRAGKHSLVVSDSNNTAEQILINKLNSVLNNYGQTIDMANISFQRSGVDKDMLNLLGEMNSGKVQALFVLGDANPLFELPNGNDFKAAFGKVGLKVAMGTSPNETSLNCNYVAPTHHFLETWDDVQPKSGFYGIVQPTIDPLFKTRNFQHSLLKWAAVEGTDSADFYYNFIQNQCKASVFLGQSQYSSFQSFWDSTLHDGFSIRTSEISGRTGSFDLSGVAGSITKPSSSKLELKVYEPIGVGNGIHSNNPWLQELPDPVTRVVWDNYLHIPIKWNEAGKFEYLNNLDTDGDLVDLKANGIDSRIPIVRQFGMPDGTCAIALGYGRQLGGRGAVGVGKNMNICLKRDSDGNIQYFVTGIEVSNKVGKDERFASVQHHHTLGVRGKDQESNNEVINVDEKTMMTLGDGFQGSLTKRTILRDANLSNLQEKSQALKEERKKAKHLNEQTLYPDYSEVYNNGHHWGLSVDLNGCIGCGACQVACVAENNVPIVGKKEVNRHHEMTWMRIDRYYYGDVENPSVVYQPMMCQHCDNAPCENVCPVAATNHSAEGLNQMAYNRCVGTRYCANNCPYKVRRFNWFDYTTADLFPKNENNPLKGDLPFYADNLTRMVLNPDVTVRSRGVIEKCSMCVQRIQEGKLLAKRESRPLRDGDIKTACQTACPTGAIIFGDQNDPNSELNKRWNRDTNYFVLEEINVRSKVGYQMRITNKMESEV